MQRYEILQISEMKPHPKNVKRHTEEDIREIAESIRRYGFRNPIFVWKERKIIAGVGRYLAAQRLGLQAVPCLIDEEMDEKTAIEYMIADNKTAELAPWGMDNLGDLLRTFNISSVPGFQPEEIRMLQNFTMPGSLLPEQKPAEKAKKKKIHVEVTCPNCKHVFNV